MTSIGAEMAKSTLKLLTESGQALTLRRVAEGAYDPDTGTTAAATTTDIIVNVAFVDYSENVIDGVNIVRGDRKALISALDAAGVAITLTPKPQDQIVGESDTVNIIVAKTTKVAATPVAYICQVRGP